jgi:hypothetical protein
LRRLVDDFNRDWPDIKRTRETFVLAQEFSLRPLHQEGGQRKQNSGESRRENAKACLYWMPSLRGA